VDVQEVRRDNSGSGSEPADGHIFLYENGNANYHLGTDCFALRESDQQLGGQTLLVNKSCRWCNIIVLNVYASTQGKVIIQRTPSVKKQRVYFINSQSTT